MAREQKEGRSERISHIAGLQGKTSGSHPGQVGQGMWGGGEGEAVKPEKSVKTNSPGGEF